MPTMKTERVVILMTAQQKRALAHRAKALDVSVAELVRRSAEGFGTGADEATLAALAAELHGAVRESRAAVRSALAEAAATLAYLGKRRKDRRVA
jgi:hypothetical protein